MRGAGAPFFWVATFDLKVISEPRSDLPFVTSHRVTDEKKSSVTPSNERALRSAILLVQMLRRGAGLVRFLTTPAYNLYKASAAANTFWCQTVIMEKRKEKLWMAKCSFVSNVHFYANLSQAIFHIFTHLSSQPDLRHPACKKGSARRLRATKGSDFHRKWTNVIGGE